MRRRVVPPPRRRTLLGTLGVFVAALVLWGGYTHKWAWTGIDGKTATLWDWINLLLLPTVIALAPIWVRADRRLDRRAKRFSLILVPLFALFVFLAYAVPWAWTGFPGNTLWDWFGLIVLPLAVILVPTFAEMRLRWQPRHTRAALTGLVVFAALVLGGYLADWSWTGFTGNTLWDWLHLLLLPLLVPIVLAPMVEPVVIEEVREEEEAQARAGAAISLSG